MSPDTPPEPATPRDEVRERILRSALTQFLEAGYEQTTVARIREASGVSNGALFHRFASKEAIAAAIYVEAIRSFQAAHWGILAREPGTLREAVHAIVGHQLQWIELHPSEAQFIYDRGQLDWSDAAAAELAELNRAVVKAYRRWLAPLIARGELRELSPLLFAAIVSGPAHQLAQQWLRGDRSRPLTADLDALAHAAWAGLATPEALRGTAAQARPAAATTARLRIELLDAAGQPIASAISVTELTD